MGEPGYDDEDEPEPPWPGLKAVFSGRAGLAAAVIIAVVGFWAASPHTAERPPRTAPPI